MIMHILLVILSSLLTPAYALCMEQRNGSGTSRMGASFYSTLEMGRDTVVKPVKEALPVLGKVTAAGLVSTLIGGTAYKTSEILLGTTPEQNLLMFHTTSLTTLAILGLGEFKKSSKETSLSQHRIDLKDLPQRILDGPLYYYSMPKLITKLLSPYTNPEKKKNFFIVKGPRATGKSIFLELLPHKIEEKLCEIGSTMHVEYHSIPLHALQSSYVFGTSKKLGVIIEETTKRGNARRYPITVTDEVEGVVQKGSDTRSSHGFTEINAVAKQGIQPGRPGLHGWSTNHIELISPELWSRAYVIDSITGEFEYAPCDSNTTFEKTSYLTRALIDCTHPDYQAEMKAVVEPNASFFATALQNAIKVHMKLGDGRAIDDMCMDVISRHFAIVKAAEKTDTFKQSPEDAKKAFKENSLLVAIEALATKKNTYDAVETHIKDELLQNTKNILSKKGLLLSAPDTDLTAAHHIACMLSKKGFDAAKIEEILNGENTPRDFNGLVDLFAKKLYPDDVGARLTAKIAPWTLVGLDSELNIRTEPLLNVVNGVLDTEGIQQATITTDSYTHLARATKKDVVSFPVTFKTGNVKHDVHFKQAHEAFLKTQPTPYLAAVGSFAKTNNNAFAKSPAFNPKDEKLY